MYGSWLFTFFTLIGATFVYSQTYHPMLDHNSEWHVTSCSSGCFTDVYYTDGDTIDAGVTYTVLNGYHYISRTFWIRENVSTQKVYMSYIDPIRGREEVLLYDYSILVGDTLEMLNPVSPFVFDGGFFAVDSIINVPLFDGQNYRVYYFSPTASNPSTEKPVWIESIGSLTIINGPGGSPNLNAVGKVSCYFNDGFLNYTQTDSIAGCTAIYVTGIDETSKNELSIYPNPCSDFLRINASGTYESINIYNVFGQLLLCNEFKTNTEIDLRNFENGVYYIILKNDFGNEAVSKIIKR